MRRRRHVVSVMQPAWDERTSYGPGRVGWCAFWDGLRKRLAIRPEESAEMGGAVSVPCRRELAQRASLCDNDETGRGARGEGR